MEEAVSVTSGWIDAAVAAERGPTVEDPYVPALHGLTGRAQCGEDAVADVKPRDASQVRFGEPLLPRYVHSRSMFVLGRVETGQRVGREPEMLCRI